MPQIQTILVTGGAGYIGSYVCRVLLTAGYQVIVLDNLSTGTKANLPEGVVFFEGDCADARLLSKIISLYYPDVVIHLAAKIDAAESIAQSELYFEENTRKTERLLTFIKGQGLKRVILASSAAVYGDSAIVPTPETAPLFPVNPYGQSKQLAEQALADFCNDDRKGVALRFFNVCGTLPEVGIGPSLEAALFASLHRAVNDPAYSFEVYGNDYPTADGTCQRDFVHVADIANAFLAVISNWNQLAQCEIINIGTAEPHSIMEIIQASEQILGRSIPYQVTANRSGEIAISVADNSKMKKLLKLELPYSGLNTIIETSLN